MDSERPDSLRTCPHVSADDTYSFDVPVVGKVNVCWECRKALALRLHLYPEFGLVPVDDGRLVYKCSKCGEDFTTTDPCKCKGSKAECAANRKALKAWRIFMELTAWKPKKPRERTTR